MVQIGGKAALNSAGMTSKMAPLYPSDGPKMAALWPGRPENLNWKGHHTFSKKKQILSTLLLFMIFGLFRQRLCDRWQPFKKKYLEKSQHIAFLAFIHKSLGIMMTIWNNGKHQWESIHSYSLVSLHTKALCKGGGCEGLHGWFGALFSHVAQECKGLPGWFGALF